MLGDVQNRDIDPDLRLYLKTALVLHWGENRFWEKLKYALPDQKSCGVPNGSVSSTQSSVVSSNTSILSSMSTQYASNNVPRYTMRPPSVVQQNNNLHHIYNMPQYGIYGGAPNNCQVAAVHI